MDAARYARICELFDEVEPLSLPDRQHILAQACGGDNELRAEVERMLSGARRAPLSPAVVEGADFSGPITFLHLAARALLDGLCRPDQLAQALWNTWVATRTGAIRQAEFDLLRREPPEDLRRRITQMIVEILPNGPADRRQALANVLVEVVRSARTLPVTPSSATSVERLFPETLPSLGIGEVPALVLQVVAGPYAGRNFSFADHDTFLVGRSSQTHFNLGKEDRYFSRIHFMIEANPPLVRLVDMGSHNGTFVNGQRVQSSVRLVEGDRIGAGHTVLRVALPGCLPLAMQLAHLPTVSHVATPAKVQQSNPSDVALGGPCRICNPVGSELPVCKICVDLIASQTQPVSGYTIVRELGRGGMGVVYLATRNVDGAVVALKTVIPAVATDAREVARFLREARILCELDHPHVVSFRDMGEENQMLYFAMDYVQGCDAARLLKRNGPLEVTRAVGLVSQLLLALDYAHAKRFVHRDIKPANMLVTLRDGREHVYLADFGLARVYQASQLSGLTVTGAIGGTPAFMAPEQVTRYRESLPPVDQYAAAATLYHLLTASYPHDLGSNIQEQLARLLLEEPIPIQERRSDLPDALAAVIHRALSRKPQQRYADAKSFRRALAPFLRD